MNKCRKGGEKEKRYSAIITNDGSNTNANWKSLYKCKLEISILTGLERSGSRKTTRKICSTATWSFCSSNCFQGEKILVLENNSRQDPTASKISSYQTEN